MGNENENAPEEYDALNTLAATVNLYVCIFKYIMRQLREMRRTSPRAGSLGR